MSRRAFNVIVDSSPVVDTTGPDRRQFVAEFLQRGVQNNLEAGGEWFQSADIRVTLADCRFEGTYARVAASITGQVNDVEFASRTFEADISAPVGAKTMAMATGGLAGVAVQSAIDSAIEGLRSEERQPPNPLDQKVLFQLLDYLDSSVGRTSPLAARWKRIQLQRWFGGLVAFVLLLAVGLLRGGLSSNGVVAGLLFGALAAPLGFLLVHCAGLVTMPESFFATETAGKKALMMTGVPSVGALRVVIIIALCILVASFLGVLVLAWGSAHWD